MGMPQGLQALVSGYLWDGGICDYWDSRLGYNTALLHECMGLINACFIKVR